MTRKELIGDLRNCIQVYCPMEYVPSIDNFLNSIEKDLEVLEILKDHYIKVTFDTSMTKEEKTKINEWIENEKQIEQL